MPDLDFGYESYLSQVPEALREQIEPAFKSYSEKLAGEYKTEADQFKPYREFEEQGWEPEHVGVGLNLLKQLNDNPQVVLDAILQEYPQLQQGLQQQQNTNQLQQTMQQQQQQNQLPFPNNGNTNGNTSDMDLPPALLERMDQQEKIINLMFQGFQQQQDRYAQQQTMEQEQNELKAFNAELDKVAPSDKYPRDFILSYISQGQTPDQAVKSFESWYSSEQAKWRGGNAPLVAPGSGGGMPAEPIDTSKLSSLDRRNLITQYLEAANRQ